MNDKFEKYNHELIDKLSKGMEESPASIMLTDLDGNIEYVNPKFRKLPDTLWKR